ncbi:ATP-binding cassette domain-containing protein [Gammaproteobacteria bacterium LSUCC0057]|uniref:ATP-binding cassette domain-containing protein n=1 Tax=Gammaproteobacteria bacterium LSUCC0057 TaxID=2559237 RepID=A0A4Y8ULN3_9GAMM|nr:ATP-binding cassette domain-containing protein [Gammaproteobacteria bacterium LSUCC0057]
MLQAEQLTKQVSVSGRPLQILDDVNLTLQRGDSLAIVGASGSGKSTLLGLLAGLDLPSSGRVTLAGEALSTLDEDRRAALRERYVGFVFQSFQLLPSLTALENVALPLELRGTANAERLAADFLQRVGLDQRLHHYPRQLSGGEQQRVALARAFACAPQILFADEPTGNLDTVTGTAVHELLFALNQEQGTTLVLVTHEQSLAARCEKTLTLAAGRVVA